MRILNARGGTSFWQWDTGRKIVIIGDEDICGEAHFCTGSGDPFPVTIRTEDGQRVADVPDEILQEAKPFTVYLYRRDGSGGATRYSQRFTVHPRTKPTDYIYTPTERKTWEELEKKIESLGIIKLYVCSDGEYTADGHPVIPKPDKDTTYLVPQDAEGHRYASWVYAGGAWQFVEELTVTLDETDGETDEDGKDGLTAYEIAVKNGFAGTEQEWLESLKGEDGKDGQDGSPGKDGADGQPGKDGKDGAPGADYVLTDADRQEIAEQAAGMVDVPKIPAENTFELIERVQTTEELNAFARSQEPNGKAYDFKRLHLNVIVPVGTSNNAGYTMINGRPSVYYATVISSGNIMRVGAVAGVRNGALRVDGRTSADTDGAQNLFSGMYRSGYMRHGQNTIYEISINVVSGNFPIGTVFEIWGVRA